MVITGSIDPLLFYDSDFAIIDNPYTPSFNSSIMRFKTGARPDIWTDFSEKIAKRLPGDQDWLGSKCRMLIFGQKDGASYFAFMRPKVFHKRPAPSALVGGQIPMIIPPDGLKTFGTEF